MRGLDHEYIRVTVARRHYDFTDARRFCGAAAFIWHSFGVETFVAKRMHNGEWCDWWFANTSEHIVIYSKNVH